jgi:hypothetical protein
LASAFQTLQRSGDNRVNLRHIRLRHESQLRRASFDSRWLLGLSAHFFFRLVGCIACAAFLNLTNTFAQILTPLRARKARYSREFDQRRTARSGSCRRLFDFFYGSGGDNLRLFP